MWLIEVNTRHLHSKLLLFVCMRDKRGCCSINLRVFQVMCFGTLDNLGSKSYFSVEPIYEARYKNPIQDTIITQSITLPHPLLGLGYLKTKP
jgi:hypothetical protein